MGRLLDQAVGGTDAATQKAIFRVLLDVEGRVRDVVLKRSSGARGIDGRGFAKLLSMKLPPAGSQCQECASLARISVYRRHMSSEQSQ